MALYDRMIKAKERAKELIELVGREQALNYAKTQVLKFSPKKSYIQRRFYKKWEDILFFIEEN